MIDYDHYAHLQQDDYTFSSNVTYRYSVWVPSIFGASQFGRWVVTHSLTIFDFHDHRPTVRMNQHPLW